MVENINKAERQSAIKRSATPESTTLDNLSHEMNFVRNKLENFQKTIVHDVEQRMSGLIEEVLQQIRTYELQSHEFKNFTTINQQSYNNNNTWNNRKIVSPTNTTVDGREASVVKDSADKRKNYKLPEKIFVTRESYLTALLEIEHMKAIYHIFYVIVIIFLINGICHDYFVEGRMNFGLETFKLGLGKLHFVFLAWSLQHIFIFTLYYAVQGWASVRNKLAGLDCLQRFWSHSCLILYICSQLVFGYVASALCPKLDLPFVSASILLLESTRLLMKMHAYVRTIVARQLAGKLKSDDQSNTTPNGLPMPPFSCYLYYLFAPTLIYRDHYPRTTQIRWKFAFARFLEIVAIAFLYSHIYERHIHFNFAKFGIEELTPSSIIVKLFGMTMPAIIIFLCGFYMILHSWLNFTAELLRFGDRMFYKDWWTAHTYEAYYRNWNVVVHDWFYEYLYKDCYNYIFKGSKFASTLTVFMVSAIVHEHIVGFALQLFFPVLFVFFGGVSVILVFITRRAPKSLGNILLWFSLVFGYSLLMSLYSMEHFARINCPKEYNSWSDYFKPALINCYRD